MISKRAHSRFGSSSAPSPHRNELPVAENSFSVNTSPTVEKALMLKSPPMKSTLCSNNEQDHAPSTIARRNGIECENYRFRLKGVLVEQDSEVRIASMRNELIGDVRNMITGFLKNNRIWLPEE